MLARYIDNDNVNTLLSAATNRNVDNVAFLCLKYKSTKMRINNLIYKKMNMVRIKFLKI